MASPRAISNFSILSQHDEQLLRLGMLAEKYFADDPNTCLLKLRQLTESLAQLLAARTGLFISAEETQYDLPQQVLASHQWTAPQRDWLKRIASQTKANLLVDRAALDDPDLLFKREGGGFDGFDKLFNARSTARSQQSTHLRAI